MPHEIEPPQHWLTPALATLIVGGVTLSATGLAAVAYTPLRTGLDEVRHDVAEMRADPRARPEARIRMDAISERLEELSRRVERVDERLANLHLYIMQVVPPPKTPGATMKKTEAQTPSQPN